MVNKYILPMVWHIQLRVSTMWDATKPENREFIKKLEDARFVFTQIRNNG